MMAEYRIAELGRPPVYPAMERLSTEVEKTVNRLCDHVKTLEAIIHRVAIVALERSGLTPIMGKPGDLPQKRLESLLKSLGGANAAGGTEAANITEEAARAIAEGLDSLINLSKNYSFRRFMRPAVTYCQPIWWGPDGKVQHRLFDLIRHAANNESKGASKEDMITLPTTQHPDQAHVDAVKQIALNALNGVKCILDGPNCKLDLIAEDVLQDCFIKLCHGDDANERAWEDLLFDRRDQLIGAEISRLRANSQYISEFKGALRKFEETLA